MRAWAWAADIGMAILLPGLMAYSLVGEDIHEFLGIAIFALFLGHQASHWWYFRHWRAGLRIEHLLSNIVNVALIIAFLIVPCAGLCMSTSILPQLAAAIGHAGIFRRIHFIGAYWAFALACIHAGMHASMMWAAASRQAQDGTYLRRIRAGVALAWAVGAGLGAGAFIRRDIWGYMSGRVAFADFTGGLAPFLVDYLLLMCFFSALGWCMHAVWARLFPPHSAENRAR